VLPSVAGATSRCWKKGERQCAPCGAMDLMRARSGLLTAPCKCVLTMFHLKYERVDRCQDLSFQQRYNAWWNSTGRRTTKHKNSPKHGNAHRVNDEVGAELLQEGALLARHSNDLGAQHLADLHRYTRR